MDHFCFLACCRRDLVHPGREKKTIKKAITGMLFLRPLGSKGRRFESSQARHVSPHMASEIAGFGPFWV
jgi:hypothetical protein